MLNRSVPNANFLSVLRIPPLGKKIPVPDEATQADVVPLLYRAELHRHPEFFALLSDPDLLSAVRVLLPEADRIRVYPNYRYDQIRVYQTTGTVLHDVVQLQLWLN